VSNRTLLDESTTEENK